MCVSANNVYNLVYTYKRAVSVSRQELAEERAPPVLDLEPRQNRIYVMTLTVLHAVNSLLY